MFEKYLTNKNVIYIMNVASVIILGIIITTVFGDNIVTAGEQFIVQIVAVGEQFFIQTVKLIFLSVLLIIVILFSASAVFTVFAVILLTLDAIVHTVCVIVDTFINWTSKKYAGGD